MNALIIKSNGLTVTQSGFPDEKSACQEMARWLTAGRSWYFKDSAPSRFFVGSEEFGLGEYTEGEIMYLAQVSPTEARS